MSNRMQSPASKTSKKKGAPKKDLEPLWDEHRRRRGRGLALLTVAREVKALKARADANLPGGCPSGEKSIRNRLLSRFAGPGPNKAARYDLELVHHYLAHGLGGDALKSLAAAIKDCG